MFLTVSKKYNFNLDSHSDPYLIVKNNMFVLLMILIKQIIIYVGILSYII